MTENNSPSTMRARFLQLDEPRQLAVLLNIKYSRLVWHIYKSPKAERYTSFAIPKKAGGVRNITAPVSALKMIQRELARVLGSVYEPKVSVHGYVQNRSIKTNAEVHRNQRYVFNIDLQDFFPSINFGRVRGLFMAAPYRLDDKVATVVAQICCFDNQLPQGAPTSPIVSNMICARMDTQLLTLATGLKCSYTRYADDLTFSTSTPFFPGELGIEDTVGSAGRYVAGSDLADIVVTNGFQVNASKIRLQTNDGRQMVTGLTVNGRVNVRRTFVRQIRAMLHDWEFRGEQIAQQRYLEKYASDKYRNPSRPIPPFRYVLRGKIEFLKMVRGPEDCIYLKCLERYDDISK